MPKALTVNIEMSKVEAVIEPEEIKPIVSRTIEDYLSYALKRAVEAQVDEWVRAELALQRDAVIEKLKPGIEKHMTQAMEKYGSRY